MKVIATPDALADAVHELANQNNSVDLSPIREALEDVEGYRIRALLRTMADVEAVKPVKMRRFILAYWEDGNVHTTRGFVSTPKKAVNCEEHKEVEGEDEEHCVLVDDYRAPFLGRYRSMQRFEARLREVYKLSYVIKYLD